MDSTRHMLEIINGYKVTNALFLLGEFDVFEYLDGEHTVYDICSGLQIDPCALTIILDLFVSLELLEKKQESCYAIKNEYKQFLHRKSPANLMGLIELETYLSQKHIGYVDMKRVLVTGTGSDTFNQNGKEGKEKLYMETMNTGNRFSAACVAREFKGAENVKILDVGGGSGIYSISLAKKIRSISIDLVDRPEMKSLCEENIEKAGVTEQICFIPGDICTIQLAQNYDGVILSNILHLLNKNEMELLFHNLNRHLSDHATIVFHDFFINRKNKRITSMYTLDWMMHGSFFHYSTEDFISYIDMWGWKLKRIRNYGQIESTIIVANKE